MREGGRTIGCLGVALLARAWIEIGDTGSGLKTRIVALLARAWIEMFYEIHYILLN